MTDDTNLTGCPGCGGYHFNITNGGLIICTSMRGGVPGCGWRGQHKPPDGPPKKVVVIAACDDCPYGGTCAAWERLTPKQRVSLVFGGPSGFILKDCHLEDAE